MKHSVLLDTSFFIRMLNDEDPLHKSAIGYFRHFIDSDITMKFSTISIAEYCVRGNINELPLKHLQIVPFNYDQAIVTGEFANAIFESKRVSKDKLKPRAIIPNDSKLFSQAQLDVTINEFITSDTRSKKTYSTLRDKIGLNFNLIDISTPHSENYGVLDL